MGFTDTLSKEEAAFIRLYVKTLQREYHILRAAIDLTSPHGLNVSSFLTAVQLATKLSGLEHRFNAKLRAVQKKHAPSGAVPAKDVVATPEPSMNDLAEVFSLSFFQLLPDPKTQLTATKKELAGWFSGSPGDWASAIKKKIKIDKAAKEKKKEKLFTDQFAPLTNLIADLFFFDSLFSVKTHAKKVWPPEDEEKSWWVDDDDSGEPDLDIGSFEDWFDSE